MTTAPKYTLETTGYADTRRVMRDGTVVVGFASQFTSGKWGPSDEDGKVISGERFDTPTGVKNWFKDNNK